MTLCHLLAQMIGCKINAKYGFGLFEGRIYPLKTIRWSLKLRLSIDLQKPLSNRASLTRPGKHSLSIFISPAIW